MNMSFSSPVEIVIRICYFWIQTNQRGKRFERKEVIIGIKRRKTFHGFVISELFHGNDWDWCVVQRTRKGKQSIGKYWKKKKEESKPLPKVGCRSCLKGSGRLNWAVYLSNAKKKKKKEKKERKKGGKCGGKEWKTWDAFIHLQIIPRWIQPAWSDGIAKSWIVRSSI